jgi:hypothetical protein
MFVIIVERIGLRLKAPFARPFDGSVAFELEREWIHLDTCTKVYDAQLIIDIKCYKNMNCSRN